MCRKPGSDVPDNTNCLPLCLKRDTSECTGLQLLYVLPLILPLMLLESSLAGGYVDDMIVW